MGNGGGAWLCPTCATIELSGTMLSPPRFTKPKEFFSSADAIEKHSQMLTERSELCGGECPSLADWSKWRGQYKFKADGITPRVVPRIHPVDQAAAAKARKKKHMESTVGTKVDKGVLAIWIGFDKPEGELNRWLNRFARRKLARWPEETIGFMMWQMRSLGSNSRN